MKCTPWLPAWLGYKPVSTMGGAYINTSKVCRMNLAAILMNDFHEMKIFITVRAYI
jgi:hypothetical protein